MDLASGRLVVRRGRRRSCHTPRCVAAQLGARGDETIRERQIRTLEMAADYLDLADLRIVAPWLAEEQRVLLDSWRPDGIVRELELRFGDRSTGDFFVSASLPMIGIASVEGRPGLRGFTGDVRADHDGGRLEIASDYAVLSTRYSTIPSRSTSSKAPSSGAEAAPS